MYKKESPIGWFGVLIRVLIILAAGAFFVYGALQMYAYLSENNESNADRDKLADQAVTILIPETDNSGFSDFPSQDGTMEGSSGLDLSLTIPIRVDFDILQKENPEIVAWIYCPGTPINYPIVQGEDNQYYVHHLINGRKNAGGAIFMDFRNSTDVTDLNTLIYGHNMTNNSMFGTLENYKQQSYYDQHPIIWIVTPTRAYRLDLIAGCVTKADSDCYALFTETEKLEQHLDTILAESTFRTNVDPEAVTQIVTLSTCSYEYNYARYVVIGSVVPIDYSSDSHTESAKN